MQHPANCSLLLFRWQYDYDGKDYTFFEKKMAQWMWRFARSYVIVGRKVAFVTQISLWTVAGRHCPTMCHARLCYREDFDDSCVKCIHVVCLSISVISLDPLGLSWINLLTWNTIILYHPLKKEIWMQHPQIIEHLIKILIHEQKEINTIKIHHLKKIVHKIQSW